MSLVGQVGIARKSHISNQLSPATMLAALSVKQPSAYLIVTRAAKTVENRKTRLWNSDNGPPWVIIASSKVPMTPGTAGAHSPSAQTSIDQAMRDMHNECDGEQFLHGFVIGAVEMRDVIPYEEALQQGEAWADGVPGVSSYCMRFRRSIAFAHPFPHSGRLGITESVPLDRLHLDDRATLREATGAADDAALVACFSRSSRA